MGQRTATTGSYRHRSTGSPSDSQLDTVTGAFSYSGAAMPGPAMGSER